jgi:hypothetical protein
MIDVKLSCRNEGQNFIDYGLLLRYRNTYKHVSAPKTVVSIQIEVQVQASIRFC